MTLFVRHPRKDRREGASLNSMVVLSLLLHTLILSILFLSPSLPSPKWTFGPTYTVDLVSFPAKLLEQKSAIASTEKVLSLGREDRPTVFRQTARTALPLERSLEAQKKTEPNAVREAVGKLEKRLASSRAQEKSEERAASGGTVEVSANMRIYYAMIWSKIKDQWALPEGILPGDDFEAIVGVRIRRDGTVSDLVFEKPSGNRFFDESVLKAVKKAEPFPPFPDFLREETLDLGIRFLSSELS
jgi:TonB family protein